MTMQATTRRALISAGLVAGIALTAGCGSGSSPSATVTPSAAITPAATSAAFPVTVRTSDGPVTIRSRPTAILSLSPTATEDLYAIGAGSQVKAVDKYSDYPAGTPMTDLSEIQPNIESMVALKPDLVVLADGGDDLQKRMEALGIPVLVMPAATKLADVYSELTQLAEATGHVAQAATEEASIRSKLASIVASVHKQAQPVTYYYELSPDFYSLTSATFVGQLLKLIGLTSIADSATGAASSGGYPQLSSEFIVKSNPDFIFLADTICCQQNAAKVASRAGWEEMTAVREHHVVELSDDVASRWGPRIVDLLQTVANAVRGN
jgi:iron complex transport system substrate-binding protein